MHQLFKKATVAWGSLAIDEGIIDNACALNVRAVNGGPVGAPATLTCELGQIRKEAAAAGNACAGMSLAGPPPISALRITFPVTIFKVAFNVHISRLIPEFCRTAYSWSIQPVDGPPQN